MNARNVLILEDFDSRLREIRDGPLQKLWGGGGGGGRGQNQKKIISRKKLGKKNLSRHSAKKN